MNKMNRYLTLMIWMLSMKITMAQEASVSESQLDFYGFGRTTFVWDNRDLGRSDLFVPALGERFQKLVFSPVMNAKTNFGVLPQMTHPFDVLKEETKLRVLFIEPDRGSDYCDIRLIVDLKHKKMTFLIEDPDFQTNFINAVSRELK